MRVPAKKKLRDWLKDNGWSQRKLADTVGVEEQSSVSRWCDDAAKERPTERRRELIEGLTGISRDDWLTADERKEAKKAEERVRLAGAAE